MPSWAWARTSSVRYHRGQGSWETPRRSSLDWLHSSVFQDQDSSAALGSMRFKAPGRFESRTESLKVPKIWTELDYEDRRDWIRLLGTKSPEEPRGDAGYRSPMVCGHARRTPRRSEEALPDASGHLRRGGSIHRSRAGRGCDRNAGAYAFSSRQTRPGTGKACLYREADDGHGRGVGGACCPRGQKGPNPHGGSYFHLYGRCSKDQRAARSGRDRRPLLLRLSEGESRPLSARHRCPLGLGPA